MRINKYLAQKGITTRRGADVLIESGKVFVNGKVAKLGEQVNEGDKVTVKDEAKKAYRYILYYKPRGVITHSPGEGEVDIETQINKDHGLTGLFPVGRLDKDSEGLIMLTNDGRITKKLLSPEYEHEKEYLVFTDKPVTDGFLSKLARGVNIEGYITKPGKAVRDPRDERAFTLTIVEGKKHQIRRMCAALGYQVERLKRTRIMSFALRPLSSGNYRELNQKEKKILGSSLGLPL